MLRNPTYASNHRISDNEVSELLRIANYMRKGSMGGFAACIGDAITIADYPNLDRLRIAFSDLIQRAEDRINEINELAREINDSSSS